MVEKGWLWKGWLWKGRRGRKVGVGGIYPQAKPQSTGPIRRLALEMIKE
jgi:hypothetical protein